MSSNQLRSCCWYADNIIFKITFLQETNTQIEVFKVYLAELETKTYVHISTQQVFEDGYWMSCIYCHYKYFSSGTLLFLKVQSWPE